MLLVLISINFYYRKEERNIWQIWKRRIN